jgi:hypothetical protein
MKLGRSRFKQPSVAIGVCSPELVKDWNELLGGLLPFFHICSETNPVGHYPSELRGGDCQSTGLNCLAVSWRPNRRAEWGCSSPQHPDAYFDSYMGTFNIPLVSSSNIVIVLTFSFTSLPNSKPKNWLVILPHMAKAGLPPPLKKESDNLTKNSHLVPFLESE